MNNPKTQDKTQKSNQGFGGLITTLGFANPGADSDITEL